MINSVIYVIYDNLQAWRLTLEDIVNPGGRTGHRDASLEMQFHDWLWLVSRLGNVSKDKLYYEMAEKGHLLQSPPHHLCPPRRQKTAPPFPKGKLECGPGTMA